MSDLFDEIEALIDEDRLDEMERKALRAIPGADEEERQDLYRYIAWARLETGRAVEALEAARAGEDPLYEAKALFHLWRMDEAARLLDSFRAEGDDGAEAAWYRGLAEEFRGGDPKSFYRRAAKLDPERFPLPPRLDDAEIDRVIREALGRLPPPVAREMERAAVEVVDRPRADPDVDPLTLGLYMGRSALDASVDAPPEHPPRIEIYRKNIERIARDREEAVEELRITLLHEIGHHLGYDEEGVEGLGLA